MRDRPDFEASCALLCELGFTLEEARSTPQSFGSWFIRAAGQGKLVRVVWDGRDGHLSVQELSLNGIPGEWGERWAAGEGAKHNPAELRDGLLSVLAR